MATRGNLSLEEKCYLAGFIDGEGCLGVYKKATQNGNKGIYEKKIKGRSPQYQLYLGITNTNRAILDWIFSKVNIGCIANKKRSNPNAKQSWTLAIRGWDAVLNILDEVAPYLKVKKPQAELIYEFVKIVGAQPSHRRTTRITEEELVIRDSFFERTKQLNHRGL